VKEPVAVRIVGRLSALPTSENGPRHIAWWGNFGFMLIEGMAFLLAGACYLYLIGRSPGWPPPGDASPDLLWGTLFTAAILLSEAPNLWLRRVSKDRREAPVRWLALAMTLIGVVLAILRAFELGHLNVSWQQDAYGSVVWMLMVLHTTHIVTEVGETGVQTLWLFTHEIGDDQFADVEDDSNYWGFVVLAWLPIYVLVYWVPRWL
jgi:cytochrome c oxidase subunit 3